MDIIGRYDLLLIIIPLVIGGLWAFFMGGARLLIDLSLRGIRGWVLSPLPRMERRIMREIRRARIENNEQHQQMMVEVRANRADIGRLHDRITPIETGQNLIRQQLLAHEQEREREHEEDSNESN